MPFDHKTIKKEGYNIFFSKKCVEVSICLLYCSKKSEIIIILLTHTFVIDITEMRYIIFKLIQ